MTTLKITFYKNIKSVLVSCIGKPSFSYLWWKKGGGMKVKSGQNFFITNHIFFFTKTLMMMSVMISRMSFLILNKY
jgi:hypothetical protein